MTYYWPQQDDPGALLQKATLLESRTMIEQGTVSRTLQKSCCYFILCRCSDRLENLARSYGSRRISLRTPGFVVPIQQDCDLNLYHSEIINNARVLELGSGAGFLGVILAAIQLQSDKKRCGLWLSDLNDEVLSRCNDNIHLPCSACISSIILHIPDLCPRFLLLAPEHPLF